MEIYSKLLALNPSGLRAACLTILGKAVPGILLTLMFQNIQAARALSMVLKRS